MPIGVEKPALSTETQLAVITQLGSEYQSRLRFDPARYGSALHHLRDLYRSVRDATSSRRWSFAVVEKALGQLGLGRFPVRQTPCCKCVPFPGAWQPKTQSTLSYWHDRDARFCKTCGEHWVNIIARERWPLVATEDPFELWLEWRNRRSATDRTTLLSP